MRSRQTAESLAWNDLTRRRVTRKETEQANDGQHVRFQRFGFLKSDAGGVVKEGRAIVGNGRERATHPHGSHTEFIDCEGRPLCPSGAGQDEEQYQQYLL